MVTKPLDKYVKGEIRVHGNCEYHSMYKWPDKVFCFELFKKKEEAIVPTLGEACELWKLQEQDCYCIQEALENTKNSSKP